MERFIEETTHGYLGEFFQAQVRLQESKSVFLNA